MTPNVRAVRELLTEALEYIRPARGLPCKEWRALEWDGAVSVFCPVREHTIYGPQESGIIVPCCFCVGIREGDESVDRAHGWDSLPLRTTPDDCDYPESRTALNSGKQHQLAERIRTFLASPVGEIDTDAIALRCGLKVIAGGFKGRRDAWINFALELEAIVRATEPHGKGSNS